MLRRGGGFADLAPRRPRQPGNFLHQRGSFFTAGHTPAPAHGERAHQHAMNGLPRARRAGAPLLKSRR